MDDTVYATDVQISWGPAERAAVDRALSAPGLSERAPRKDHHRGSLARLSRTIEAEIIPRLMLAHSADADAEARRPAPVAKLDSSDVAELAALSIGREPDAVSDRAESALARGHSLETVLLDLLAPTARLLGHMWTEDLCSFTDVTIGLSRLQQVLRRLVARAEAEAPLSTLGRIALAPVPGEQHTFGLSVLESFFRRAGWAVAGGVACSRGELMDLVRSEIFDVIGLSLSHDVLIEEARSLIQAVRKVSLNPAVFVMVGGPYFLDNPHRVAEIGADGASCDAPDALRRAHACLGAAVRRS